MTKIKNDNIMRYLGIFLFCFLMASFSSCNNKSTRSGCQQEVTAVDRTGLDGCGFLFQISQSERLEPVEWSVIKPLLEDGKKYTITYEPVQAASICMAGKTVRVTCITPAED